MCLGLPDKDMCGAIKISLHQIMHTDVFHIVVLGKAYLMPNLAENPTNIGWLIPEIFQAISNFA